MPVASLVDLVHDGTHLPWLSCSRLLLSSWNLSLSSGNCLFLIICHNHHVKGLFLPALLSFSTPTLLVLVAMSIWLTVLAAYWALGTKYSGLVRNKHDMVAGGSVYTRFFLCTYEEIS